MFRPINRMMKYSKSQKLKNLYSKAIKKAENVTLFKKISPDKKGRLGISFCEMILLKGMLGPVMFPVKV